MAGSLFVSSITGSSAGTDIDGLSITGSVTIIAGLNDVTSGYALSASSNVSASAFYGDGSNLSGVTGDARSVAGDTDNAIISWVTSDNTFAAEGNLLFDGSTLTVTGDATVTDDLTLNSDSAVFNMGAGNDFTITHDGTTGATIAGNPVTITSAGAATWSTAAGALTVDAAAAALTLDGHTGVTVQSSNSGDITLDSVADIVLDADGADVLFKDGGTLIGGLKNTATNLVISSSIADKDIMFMGSDDNVAVTAMTLDMSAGGSALLVNDLSLTSDSSVFNMGAGSDFTITHDGTTGATIAGNPVTITSAGAATWSTSAGALTVDAAAAALTLDGHTGVTVQSSNSGDITLDSVADIVLDAGGADVLFKDDGTLIGGFKNTATNLVISSSIADKDIMFMGSDDGTTITALTLDMSDAGTAIFSGDVSVGDDLTLKSDASVLGFGTNTDVTLTHVHDTGILLNSTMAIQFNDSSQYIKASSGADLDIAATTDINLDCTTVDVNAALDVSGATTLNGAVTLGDATGDDITVTGYVASHVISKTTNTYDLGSSALRWRNIYTADMNFANDRGDWTLIEENDFISFRNNNTGQRFRMVMEDITDSGDYGPDIDGNL